MSKTSRKDLRHYERRQRNYGIFFLVYICYTFQLSVTDAFPYNFSNNKREGNMLVSAIEPPPSNYVALPDPS